MKTTASLNRNRDFKWLYARGKSAVGVCLAVYMRKNRRSDVRLGLTVSTKLGNAVKRNRARRRISEAFRLNAHRFLPGHDLVIVARARVQTIGFAALQKDLLKVCGKLGLLKTDADMGEAVRREPDARLEPAVRPSGDAL